MTHDQHGHNHHNHGHDHPPKRSKGLHKSWVTWLVVGLMLAAMAVYVLSDNEALQPGGEGERMPAAPAAGP